jgi:hypothetical protein
MPEDKPAYPRVEKNPKKLVRSQQALVIRAMRSEVSSILSALNHMRNDIASAVKAATVVERNIDELQAALDNEIEPRHLDPSFNRLPELPTGSIQQCQDSIVRLECLVSRHNELRKIFTTLSRRK